jgi:hypothetical protein
MRKSETLTLLWKTYLRHLFFQSNPVNRVLQEHYEILTAELELVHPDLRTRYGRGTREQNTTLLEEMFDTAMGQDIVLMEATVSDRRMRCFRALCTLKKYNCLGEKLTAVNDCISNLRAVMGSDDSASTS